MASDVKLTSILPVATAIGVFGVVYGAAAQPLFGTTLTLVSSVVIFSGTAQFTMVGLAATASSPLAVLWAVFVVNLRNFALGAAVRPHLKSSGLERFGLSWFLIDETVGLALAAPEESDRTLLRAGSWAYGAWVLGTALGVAGGATFGLEEMANAVFPVLFIGLAALMVNTLPAVIRSIAAAGLTLVLLLVWPGLEGLAPVAGGVIAAVPGGRNE